MTHTKKTRYREKLSKASASLPWGKRIGKVPVTSHWEIVLLKSVLIKGQKTIEKEVMN